MEIWILSHENGEETPQPLKDGGFPLKAGGLPRERKPICYFEIDLESGRIMESDAISFI
jgi:hypothetical protein